MKVVFLSDNLGSGGAQRQLCTLAVLLRSHGWDITVLTYHSNTFFLPILQDAGVKHEMLPCRSKIGRVFSIRRFLCRFKPDVVLAFQSHCSIYAEITSIPRRKWGLVVSERSAVPGSHRGWRRWLRLGHLLADYVTTNSHTNRLMIERSVPLLKGRVITIYNAVDLNYFSPAQTSDTSSADQISLVTAATFRVLKNPLRLVEALGILKDKYPTKIIILNWYGRLPNERDPKDDMEAYCKLQRFINNNGLEDRVHFHPAVPSIVDIYRSAHAVVLPSMYEGLPNVVCEAMACGKPILMSNVSDSGNLVQNGYNGFLFNPDSVTDMADAIMRFANLSSAEIQAMGENSRSLAEKMFDPSLIASCYSDIISAVAKHKTLTLNHSISQVPESAETFLNK